MNHNFKSIVLSGLCSEAWYLQHFLMFTFHPDSDEKFYESSKSFAEDFSHSPSDQAQCRGGPHTGFEGTFATLCILAVLLTWAAMLPAWFLSLSGVSKAHSYWHPSLVVSAL